jgi:hypothetical protein
MRFYKFYLFLLLIFIPVSIFSQIDDEAYYDSLLYESVKVENPVYKPVIGGGIGVMNFIGELKSSNSHSFSLGQPAYKFNVATFLDKKHYFRANFFIIMGSFTGESRSVKEPLWNLNFKSDIVDFGLNIHYDFQHFFRNSPLLPFVSVGLENVQFNSKTDIMDKNGNPYNYLPDGTIRDIDDNIIQRDYIYETNLRNLDLYGLGNYSQSALAIPFEIGLDYKITDRLNLRVGHSWHYAFTDLIDNVSRNNKTPGQIVGDKKNDVFTFTYLTMHFDLFSEDRIITYKNLFADVEFNDYEMFGDEDNDQVRDIWDKCPGTPYGVVVDSITGCPLDDDKDGIANYLDKELNTRSGAMVDENGIELNSDAYAEQLNFEAIRRKDVEMFLLMHRAQSKFARKSNVPIPAKYKKVDSDGDNYISFEELLKTIDDFFDFSTDYKTKDIYELQDFFFEQ